jgi:hypothetical protein
MLKLLPFLFFIGSLFLYSADSTKVEINSEGIVADSTLSDSVEVVEIYSVLSELGKSEILTQSDCIKISKEDIQEEAYLQLGDILYENLNFYPMSLGSFGMYNHISIYGANPTASSFNYNGRSINDLQFGSLNPEQISPESFENLEIYTGSDAVIFGDNAQGGYFNIQQKKYNAGKPYSRLWYAQAGFEFLAADIIYSQNFRPNWNFTLGIRNMTTDGRYENQFLRSWNVRAALRWNLSDLTSVTLTENFVNHGMGANGGVNREESSLIFDEIFANVNYNDLNRYLYRHDLTLNFTSILDKDSINAVSLNAYFTNSEWEHDARNDFYFDYTDSTTQLDYFNNKFGMNGKYELNFFDYFFLNVGGSIENVTISNTPYNSGFKGLNYNAYGRGELIFADEFKLTGGGKLAYFYGKSALSFGSAAHLKFGNLSSKFDVSISERVPTPAEGLELEKENHLLSVFDLNLNLQPHVFSLSAFVRYIDSPIIFDNEQYSPDSILIDYQGRNADNEEIYGLGAKLDIELFSGFRTRINTIMQYSKLDGNDSKKFPLFYSDIDLNYSRKFKNNKLSGGVRLRLISEFYGQSFFPQRRVYVPVGSASTFSNNGIDLYATAVLGDAFIKLEFMNALSQGYYYVPYYPQLTRNLVLSVAWSFLN